MKLSLSSVLVLALAAESTVASTWWSGSAGKAAYNKWHETELERWLGDHNIPYPTPADRKDLENLVKTNWESKTSNPYTDWEPAQLQSYLKSKGQDVKKGTESNKNSLVSQVKGYWSDATDSTAKTFDNVKDWIFDGWSDSQLKSFLDKHDIPAPQPRKRDSLIATARSNYDTIAKKLGQTTAYPGNWLYESWSESDLKEFLDERGVPVPQPSSRDKLIASVRRNSRLSAQGVKDTAASASASANAAKESLSDALLDSWSDSQIKDWADKNGIKVPQGSKRNELVALAKKNRNALTDGGAASSVSSAYGAATSAAGNQYAKASDDLSLKSESTFDQAVGTWSDSRLKAFLDARGVPVPQAGNKDELVKQVRLNKHKASTGWSAWTFDTWSTENLKKWLTSQNNKAASKAGASRNDLLKQAQDSYASASKSGGSNYASVTSYLASATDAAKDSTFDTWSESDLKSYLDTYGVPNYQGSTTNELRAMARRNANYFRYGTSTPQEGFFARIQGNFQWVLSQLKLGASSGSKEAGSQSEKAADAVKEGATAATNRAGEAAQKAGDKIKEEL
ncbi:2-hydroxyacid dehydrogenase UNK4.10 [Physcia stellaris]|nr:2-hydroxyacid dehydrogenase UNK4.10 [Physcia stellaris]